MRIRKAAHIALAVGCAVLLAAAVGCGFGFDFDFGLGDDPPEDEGLIKDLVLLYEPPATETAVAQPALTPTPTLAAIPPQPTPAATAAPAPPELTPIPQATAAAATATAAAANIPVGIAGASFENEPPTDGETYYYGEEIRVSFSFDSAVEVIGRPWAQLVIGAARRDAVFANIAEHDPATVHFVYIVQNNDLDEDGIVLLERYVADAGNYIRKQGSADAHDIAVRATAPVRYDGKGGKVDGRRLQPGFAATATALHLAYAPNQSIAATELPAASGGNGALTYELHQCAGGGNDDGKVEAAGIPLDWLTYQPPGPTDNHGGKLTPVGDATPSAVMDALCFTLTVQDADGDRTDSDAAQFRFTVAVGHDYDTDADGLVEVNTPAQLDAIRWDLDGDGAADTGGADTDAYVAAGYAAAFPNPLDGMGCPAPTGCIGYELTQNLDLAADYSNGNGWTPLGSPDHPFNATLDGQGYAIANLSISRNDAATNGGALGLFGAIGRAGVVQNLGLTGVSVRYAGAGAAAAPVGSIAGRSSGTVSNCYVAGVVTGAGSSAVGGLIGHIARGTVTGSYAAVDVSGGSGGKVGGLAGLVGPDDAAITDSYAVGAVSGGPNAGVGGLVGELDAAGRIASSYAAGAVGGGAGSMQGGLVGIRQDGATVANSYYDAGSTGQSAAGSADSDTTGTGKITRELQSLIDNTGIYREWDAQRWDLGTARQYPALRQGDGSLVPGQRRVAILVDNWNYPVVGEAVEGILNVKDAAGVSWQWQSSGNGAIWRDIAGATAAIYVPNADDAADGGKYLRAKVVFTAAGVVESRTTVNTAKVAATAAADTGAVAFVPPVAVGSKLEYRLSGADIAAAAWRWQICDDLAMTQDCVWIPDGEAAYTPQAADAGKYLRAYVYYRDGVRWQKATYPVIGPVAAAPTTP